MARPRFLQQPLILASMSGLLAAAAQPLVISLFEKSRHPPGPTQSLLVFVCLIPLLRLFWLEISFRRRLLCSWWAGMMYSAISWFWLWSVAERAGAGKALGIGLLLGAAACGGLFWAVVMGSSDFIRRSTSSPLWFIFPLVWAVTEHLRPLVVGDRAGLELGVSLWQHPLLIQAAAFGGVELVSWWIVLVNACLASLLFGREENRVRRTSGGLIPVSVLLGVSLLFVAGGYTRFGMSTESSAGEPLPSAQRPLRVAALHVHLPAKRPLQGQRSDTYVQRRIERLRHQAEEKNAALVFSPRPFAPLPGLEWICSKNNSAECISTALLDVRSPPRGCAVDQNLADRKKGRLLGNLFQRPIPASAVACHRLQCCPSLAWQQLGHDVLESVKRGRPLLRPSLTGISAVISSRGELLQLDSQDSPRALVADVQLREEETLGANWAHGGWLLVTLLLVVMLCLSGSVAFFPWLPSSSWKVRLAALFCSGIVASGGVLEGLHEGHDLWAVLFVVIVIDTMMAAMVMDRLPLRRVGRTTIGLAHLLALGLVGLPELWWGQLPAGWIVAGIYLLSFAERAMHRPIRSLPRSHPSRAL